MTYYHALAATYLMIGVVITLHVKFVDEEDLVRRRLLGVAQVCTILTWAVLLMIGALSLQGPFDDDL